MALEDEELDDTEEVESTEKKGNATMKIVLIVNAVLLLIGISVGVTYFLLSDDEPATKVDNVVDTEVINTEPAEQEVAAEDVVAEKPASGKHIYVPLKPAFVVNFENPEQVSLLQVDVQLMTYDPAVEKAINIHMPRIRNELLLLFGGKQYHEINTREGKRKLSQDAIMEIQRVLQEEGEPSSVEALYFTSFVMQ